MRLLLFVLAVTFLGSGCAWTMSSKRSQRISDCLDQCNAQRPARGPASRGGYNDPSHGIRDARSDCERRCHSL